MSQRTDGLTVGIIGCGHWGPNHARVFSELDDSCVVACADLNPQRLEYMKKRFPQTTLMRNHRDILTDPSINAVVIATPTMTHDALTREALEAGKHVLVEKPLCTRSETARELGELAKHVDRVLMVGHVFLFNGGIRKLREVIQEGKLGRLHYLDAVRTNLGPVRGDVNALYDLGTHDISIFNYLMDAEPIAVSALGSCISQQSIQDVCFATLRYASGTLAHIHVSWLNPRKVRTLTVVGERSMAHWDDIDPSDTLRVYDKGLDEPPYYNSFGEFRYLLRSGDVRTPAVSHCEPLVEQAKAFRDWVLSGVPCGCGAAQGVAVARVLEAAMRSMECGGVMCPLDGAAPCIGAVATAPTESLTHASSESLTGVPAKLAAKY